MSDASHPMHEESLSLCEYNTIPQIFKERRKCANCGDAYFERQNIGFLSCRVHPAMPIFDKERRISIYACCGVTAETTEDPRCHSATRINRKGCLRLDHTVNAFSSEDTMARLEDINAFAMIVTPQLFYKFVVPPLAENVLYFSNDNTASVFTFPLYALDEANAAYRRRLLLPCTYDRYGSADYTRGPFFSELDIATVQETITEESIDSPFFQSNIRETETYRAHQLLLRCEEAWRDNFDGDSNALPTLPIPFHVVRRIDARLSYSF